MSDEKPEAKPGQPSDRRSDQSNDLPPAPVGSFASDNAAGVSPEVLEALVAANHGPALAYGDDDWTRRAEAAWQERFDAPVVALPCWGGTGANVVGIASVLRGWEGVIATDTAHVVVDECGALSRFAGTQVSTVPHHDGRLDPDDLEPFLHWQGSEHHVQPRVVSITQATEMGTLYTVDQIGEICDRAHSAGLLVHLDGARIANALVATGSDLPTMIRDTGVDVMTVGLTKDGAMYGETVVHLRPELAEHARFVRKQAGQLPSKARFVAAQVLALLTDDLWLRNARHANEMAQLLAGAVGGIDGVTTQGEPEVNAVFAQLPAAAIVPLQEWSFFWEWDLTQSLVRWMTSFATTPDDVERFAAGVDAILARHR
ncbi:MAG: aminotransferase class V-fold PLP-dependent enzyme [Acidimicrobiales bacterium]|mgnify:CR=1 FL=1|nr:aminotransferase class V-fold PLP-dependent enzyme [Acidimicrobiales bacterium]